jgi:hypothetical protein
MRIGGLAAALVLTASPAAAHWEFTRWGMTERQVVAASRGSLRALPRQERRAVPAARMEYRVGGEFRSGELRLRVVLAFDQRNGGLVCVSARGDALLAGVLRARLERSFGRPAESGTDPTTGTETLAWTRPDEINLDLTPGQPMVLLQCSRGT